MSRTILLVRRSMKRFQPLAAGSDFEIGYRVAVTGMGAVTPLAPTMEASWEALKSGARGTGAWEKGDKKVPRFAGIARGFQPADFLGPKEIKRASDFALYALAASVMAIRDAGVGKVPSGSSVIIGSSRGGLSDIDKALRGKRKISPFLMPSTTVGMAASIVAKALGIDGRALGISSSCASGASAIGEAFCLVRGGFAPLAIAGGAESPLCELAFEGYAATGALSKTGVARPFDMNRDGFVLAEGAAVLVLEDFDRAVKRGARIYGEVVGYGNSPDGFHETKPSPEGQMRTMIGALKDAGLGPSDIDYVNAHAAGTKAGDPIELQSIASVFGEKKIPVSSFKGATGHMLGASGAFEAGAALLAMREGIIPPTLGLSEPDSTPACIELIVDKCAEISAKTALSNTFGFGGLNTALVLRTS